MAKQKEYTAQDVFEMCATYMNEAHVSFVQKAYHFAEQAHCSMKRKSGEPYIIHPIQVAGILAKLHMDPDTVASGFLHDVVEDTEFTYEDMVEQFSKSVADIIDGVTKIGQVEYQSKAENKAENHRKMLLAMAQDFRVIIVKLADRLHNMRTMEYQTENKQQQKSEETLEIYAPLAHRLGMSKIKWELEDLSLRYLQTESYYNIVSLMNSKREEREAWVNETIEDIQFLLDEMQIKAEIKGRPKHIYSIYKKMVNKKKEFSEIYDLLAVRVLVDDIKDCYAVLGLVHTKWTPLPGRFKDYIAMPKPNMYQSLHTTIIGPGGTPIEIQIRTYDMHRIAEDGVAAHWAYKEGVTGKVATTPLQDRMNWFKAMMELQSDATNASEFIESVKTDLFNDRVYVFTPKGDVTELPSGSGPLDFAYSVHTELGNKTVGATVNGKNVGLDTVLVNGDIIDIRTSSSAKPSADWLKMVVTSRAKNKIKRYLKSQERDTSVARGRELLEKAIIELEFDPKDILTKERMDEVLERLNAHTTDDLLAAVGFGELSPLAVANRLTEKERRQKEKELEIQQILADPPQPKRTTMVIRDENGLIVSGGDNLLIRLARCCRPVPGDAVTGYITKGHGITVHRQDCPNVQLPHADEARLIDVEWDTTNKKIHKDYDTEIIITAYDRNGLINDVITTANSTVKKMNGINAKVDDHIATITLRVGIENIQELNRLLDKLRMITEVYRVQRVIS